METVRPIDVAKRIIENKENPEIIRRGLEILKLCAQNRDLINKATNGVKFGDLIADFAGRIEAGADANTENFPEWAVTIKSHSLDTKFLIKPEPAENKKKRIEARSKANSITGAMAGMIMLVDSLFQMSSEEFTFEINPDERDINQLRSIKDHEGTRRFLELVNDFYKHLHGLIKNHEREIDGLDSPEKEALRKRHWKKLVGLKDDAKEIMLSLPEELFA